MFLSKHTGLQTTGAAVIAAYLDKTVRREERGKVGDYQKYKRPGPDFRIHFGKHKGSMVSELPTDYMEWLLGNCEGMHKSLLISIEEELMRRKKPKKSEPVPAAQPPKKFKPGSVVMPIGQYTGKMIKDIPKDHLWQYLWDEELGDALGKDVIDAILLVHGRGYSWAEKHGYIKPQQPTSPPSQEEEEEESDAEYKDGPPEGWVPWYRPDCSYNEESGEWVLAIQSEIAEKLLSGEIKSSLTPPWEHEDAGSDQDRTEPLPS